MEIKPKTIIGRVVSINIPKGGIVNLPAKVDTGAYRSSIWASNIREDGGKLYFTLLGRKSPYFSGTELSVDEYAWVEVENSFGHKEHRYSIYLSIEVAGRRVKSNFTLANRSAKTYPVLLGRKLLKNKFIVDVSIGAPLDDEETSEKGGLL